MTNPIPLLPLPSLPNLPDLIPDLSDLSRASSSWLATLGVGLAIGFPISSAADPLDTDARPRPGWTQWLDSDAERAPDWMGEDMFYKKGAGLEYRQTMKFGESPIEVGIQGPLVRGKKDPSPFADSYRSRRVSGVGLTVEVRF